MNLKFILADKNLLCNIKTEYLIYNPVNRF